MAEETMTNTQKLERLKEIEKFVIHIKKRIKSYGKGDIPNYWKQRLERAKQKANKIGEEFKNGCGKRFGFPLSIKCGMDVPKYLLERTGKENNLCPTCQEIKEILARINNV